MGQTKKCREGGEIGESAVFRGSPWLSCISCWSPARDPLGEKELV